MNLRLLRKYHFYFMEGEKKEVIKTPAEEKKEEAKKIPEPQAAPEHQKAPETKPAQVPEQQVTVKPSDEKPLQSQSAIPKVEPVPAVVPVPQPIAPANPPVEQKPAPQAAAPTLFPTEPKKEETKEESEGSKAMTLKFKKIVSNFPQEIKGKFVALKHYVVFLQSKNLIG